MNNDNATLEVRKVPQEFNNIAKLNEHFGKFGTLVNVQVGVVCQIYFDWNYQFHSVCVA